MTFEEATREAAKLAEVAARRSMAHMKLGRVHDEDDVTGFLVGSLASQFDRSRIAGLELSASVLRHRRGLAAEERRWGADLLLHVSMETPTQKYSKGVLVQAKKADEHSYWSPRQHGTLVEQCNLMLGVTPAAFVFAYGHKGIRCGAATRVAGAAAGQGLYYLCQWTSYRFFLELFRCPIGDPRIQSATVAELPVPLAMSITFKGQLTLEDGYEK